MRKKEEEEEKTVIINRFVGIRWRELKFEIAENMLCNIN